MVGKMKVTDLKKALENLDRKELEKLVCEIYKKDNFAEN